MTKPPENEGNPHFGESTLGMRLIYIFTSWSLINHNFVVCWNYLPLKYLADRFEKACIFLWSLWPRIKGDGAEFGNLVFIGVDSDK